MNAVHFVIVAGLMGFGGMWLGTGVQSLFLMGKAPVEQAAQVRVVPTSNFTF